MENENLKRGKKWFLVWQDAFKNKDEIVAAYHVVGELLEYCVNLEERVKTLEQQTNTK